MVIISQNPVLYIILPTIFDLTYFDSFFWGNMLILFSSGDNIICGTFKLVQERLKRRDNYEAFDSTNGFITRGVR